MDVYDKKTGNPSRFPDDELTEYHHLELINYTQSNDIVSFDACDFSKRIIF